MTRIFFLLPIFLFFTFGALAAETPKHGQKANRLINEASPYLRQHAYNPVNWYPWGEEAFKKARDEHKPIFLSVGYSTCHWCHVMERESFTDDDVADYLNKFFVSIKVDRERRPDVDETYMIATQLITKRGGWPNSLFLMPDLKPFHAGTYFPKDVFLQLLTGVAGQWETNNLAIGEQAAEVSRVINNVMERRSAAQEVTAEKIQVAVTQVLKPLDAFHGGFSEAPKFPRETLLLFLARRALHGGDEAAGKALELTLEGILNGGIQDHAGGGFHRYSTDNGWRIPHFEKMLYNQALIPLVLTKAHQLTGKARYEGAARRSLDFVLSEMTSPQGGFYSAFDADSGGEEGTYYVWTVKSLKAALGEKLGHFAANVFGVSLIGNFEKQTTVLHFPENPQELAKKFKLDEDIFSQRIDKVRKVLAKARRKRVAPARDDKIIVSWNGLMISAFAEAADQFGDERYGKAARKAGAFIWENMRDSSGGLHRVYFEGKAALDGSQEDYAFLAKGFLALYDLSGEAVWLERAGVLADQMVLKFQDEKEGDYFRTVKQVTFTRGKSRSDSQIPSGNGVALEVFAKLMQRSAEPKHRERGEALLAALSGEALGGPSGNAYALMAADLLLHGDAGAKLYLGKGKVRAKFGYDEKTKRPKLKLTIAPGWHINANKVLDDFLIPTKVKLAGAAGGEVDYPKPVLRKLGFHDSDLALFEGDVEIVLPAVGQVKTKPIKAELTLQVCSDEICLEPESVVLSFMAKQG